MGVSEREVIELARAAAARTRRSARFGEFLAVDIGDDCASFGAPSGFEVVVTVDALVDGVHFDLAWTSYRDLGYKALAVNVSDLAAMGALPAYFLVSFGMPEGVARDDVAEFVAGLEECAVETGVALVGGDTVRSRALECAVTAIGFVERGRAMRRDRARIGDGIYVTGPLGLAAAGLLAAQRGGGTEADAAALAALLRPRPRVREGRALLEAGVMVCEDISDGLAREVRNICAASGVGARVHEDLVPVAENAAAFAAARGLRPLDLALGGGDDYELVACCPAEVAARARAAGVELVRVGEIVPAEEGAVLVGPGGETAPLVGGYEHTA